jgi:hypothetical protein
MRIFSAGTGAAGLTLLLAVTSSGATSENLRGFPAARAQRGFPTTSRPPQIRRDTVSQCSTNGSFSFDGVSGAGNVAGGEYSAVAGGEFNQACGEYSGVATGYDNIIENQAGTQTEYSFIGGGSENIANGEATLIGSGESNTASARDASVGAGIDNTASGVGSMVGAGNLNMATGADSFAGAGGGNTAGGAASFVGGGYYGSVSGTGNASFIGGGGSLCGCTSGPVNQISGSDSFVGAGDRNTVSANEAFLGSGQSNTINSGATYGAILGGASNKLSGPYASILGGYGNSAGGEYAAVAGGYGNTASSELSFAAGFHADADEPGSFVWSDYVKGSALLESTAANQFMVRASGGTFFYSNEAMTAGVELPSGEGAFTSLSDRNAKTGVVPLDDASILAKVASLPVSAWRYKTDSGVRHVGPMAQDFYAAFGVGVDDRHIASIDEDGVALAAIKALDRDNGILHRENALLRSNFERQHDEIAALRGDVQRLEATLHRGLR